MPDNFLATNPRTGNLKPIPNCWINVGKDAGSNLGGGQIDLYALPEIIDSKSVQYADQTVQGRAAPIKTYAYSNNRTISLTLHLYVTTNKDIIRNLSIIRAISSLAHPQYEKTYLPPNIAKIKCGKLLGDDDKGVPVVLKSYEINYSNELQWFWSEEAQTYMPLHVSIPCQFDVVYSWTSLPGNKDVIKGNY